MSYASISKLHIFECRSGLSLFCSNYRMTCHIRLYRDFFIIRHVGKNLSANVETHNKGLVQDGFRS